ncbi:HAD family hydrolase [Devriesea agamarum]|uniref:HAD family hydrolase n=1 Tax=Devriesea agamarum TaxID=472569 RepID=UPI0009FD47BA|nr:beta-phosphoglucomutase family hydrolase [Devriesea agamarum]
MPAVSAGFDPATFKAALFDLDGVLTPTAEVHMRAWAAMFSAELAKRNNSRGYTDQDYFDYVDGKPRYDGVRAFLASRGITLPEGDPSDAPDQETVCGLGNRKNDLVHHLLRTEGVQPYPGSVAYLDFLGENYPVAVVSSSRNARDVLESAGLIDRFEIIVDGTLAHGEGLPGKPAPDTYLYAAKLLGIAPEYAVVYEDAVSGVRAGAAGSFGAVVGVNRGVGADSLLAQGASIVVDDLGDLVPGAGSAGDVHSGNHFGPATHSSSSEAQS